MEKQTELDENLGTFNIIILVLTIYVLLALFVETIFVLPTETSKLLNYVDNLICFVFFIDFIRRFRNAENKLKFMRWGWIDLISSIPVIDYFRAGRLIRLVRIVRAFRSSKELVSYIFKLAVMMAQNKESKIFKMKIHI